MTQIQNKYGGLEVKNKSQTLLPVNSINVSRLLILSATGRTAVQNQNIATDMYVKSTAATQIG